MRTQNKNLLKVHSIYNDIYPRFIRIDSILGLGNPRRDLSIEILIFYQVEK